jgi:hypothetical protein
MFDLFRFFMLRPPEKPDDRDEISVADDSALHAELKRARAGDEPLAAMREVAEGFLKSDRFVGQPEGARQAAALNTLHAAMSAKPEAHLEELKTLIRNAFAEAAGDVVVSESFQSDKTRVHESLLAVKLASSIAQMNLDHLPLYARLLNVIERTAADDAALNESGAVARALARLLILPTDLFPLPSPLEQRRADKPVVSPNTGGVAAASEADKRAAALEGALIELSGITPDDLSLPVSGQHARPAPPLTERSTAPQRPGFFARLLRLDRVASAESESAVVDLAPASNGPPFTVKQQSIARFRPESQALLRELKLDLTTTPVPTVVGALRSELSRVRAVAFPSPSIGMAGMPVIDLPNFPVAAAAIAPFPPPLPAVHGHIKPVGMADLLVVKYQLLRYERGEVAYIENILKGEKSDRLVRRLETTEETTVLETETTKEEERDLQSTERFELQNETENTVAAEGNLKSGNAFSPSYGPMLEFQGGTESPVSGSQSQSSRQASNYSREVTSRSASKVTERVRKQVTLRKLREFEEKTRHSFNNTEAGAGNVTGVFQWVEKVLLGQVFNYGKRLMFDIMVPEPAAFVQQSITLNTPAGQGLSRPTEFNLSPANINESNYLSLVQQYGSNRVRPAPAFSASVSKSYKIIIPPGSTAYLEVDRLDIPPGYTAASVYLVKSNATLTRPGGRLDLIVGERWFTWFPNAALNQSGALNGETSNIAISIMSIYFDLYDVSIEITCIRTAEAFQAWQLETHAAILLAYNTRLAEYEERLANLQASSRILALGQKPDENQKLIKEELKKSCISVFTYQHFDIFGGVELSAEGYVQIKLAEAEAQGEYIRFFEQAFEWEQMIYLFYPYFWGTKFFWLFKLRLDEFDSRFKDFLKAGEARVTVPVRPGFEKAVAHYLETGELWNGTDPLDITSDTYLPIMKEIQERDAVPGTEVPYGDPWEVRLPTTLVALRDDGKLPRWKEDPKRSGHWVEEEPA